MGQSSIAQRDFSAGIVRGVGPDQIDPRGVFDQIDGFYEVDGAAFARGGTSGLSDALATPASNPVPWCFDGYFSAGRRTIFASDDDFYILDTDDHTPINLGGAGMLVPKPSAQITLPGGSSMLFIGGGHIYAGSKKTANYATGTISLTNGSTTVTGSGTTWNTLVDAGMLLQRGNERNYVVKSITDTTHLELTEPYEGVTGAAIAYTLRPIYTITQADPYPSSEFYATAAGRLLFGTGNIFGFSETQKPHKTTLTAGTPPAEIPNEHQLAEGVHLTGIGVIGNVVLLLTTGGIWALNGIAFDIVDNSGNTNHRLEPLSRELVAFGQVATWQQTLVVPCLSGIFLIDGVSSPRRVSRPLDVLWQEYTDRQYRPGQPVVYNDHLVLPVITGLAKVRDVLVARLDRPIEVNGGDAFPYSRLSSERIACPAFTVRYDESTGERKLIGAHRDLARLIDCSGWWLPATAPLTDVDAEAPEWTLVTRDFETGELTDNTVRTVRPRYELDGAGAEISAEYGFGVKADSGPRIGEVEIGGFQLGSSEEVFYAVEPLNDTATFGESNGLHPDHGRVNDHTRSIRYRFTCRDQRRRLRLRSLETFIRPSKAVRR